MLLFISHSLFNGAVFSMLSRFFDIFSPIQFWRSFRWLSVHAIGRARVAPSFVVIRASRCFEIKIISLFDDDIGSLCLLVCCGGWWQPNWCLANTVQRPKKKITILYNTARAAIRYRRKDWSKMKSERQQRRNRTKTKIARLFRRGQQIVKQWNGNSQQKGLF